MNHPRTQSDPRTSPNASLGCGGLLLRVLAPLFLIAVWLAAPPSARADGCAGCKSPGLSDLQKVPGFKLEKRTDVWGRAHADYYVLDKGECQATLDEPPVIHVEDSWLALRATGEVWNCPHSKSTDTITVESATTDSTTWSFSVTLAAELGPVGAVFKREVEMGHTTGASVTEVTRISKTIAPTFCHRIQWKAYFEVAKIKATGHFTFRQRWAWWTKNRATGSTHVIAKGDIWMECGSGTLELGRQAPISGYFELAQRGCEGAECKDVVAKQLGMFPPWNPLGGDEEEAEPDDRPAETGEVTDPEASPEGEADGDGDRAGEGEEPAEEQPTGAGSTTDEPPTDDSPVDEPAADDPTTDGPSTDEPEASEPTSSADLGEAPTGPATDPQESTP